MFANVFGLANLMRMAFVCMVVAFIGGGTAFAACGENGEDPCPRWYTGYPCDAGLADNNGTCRPCGRRDQIACYAWRSGPQCLDYLEKIDGYCRRRGGQGDLPYSGFGYDCRPGYNVGANGRCTRCGGLDQPECEPTRDGPQCRDYLGNEGGWCRARGREGEPPYSGLGFDCAPGFNVNDNDVCTACGNAGQISCEIMRDGPRCDERLDEVDGICEYIRFAEHPFTVTNNSDENVYATIMWWAEDDEMWVQETPNIPAGDTVSISIAGYQTCNPEQFNPDHPDSGTSGLLDDFINGPEDTCRGQHFQVFFWDSRGDHLAWATETSIVHIGSFLAFEYLLGKVSDRVSGGVIPIPGSEALAEFVSDVWADIRDPDGDLSNYGVHGWAWNIPQQNAWVVYWGNGDPIDSGFTENSSAPDPDTLVHPCERSTTAAWMILDGSDGYYVYSDSFC